MGERIFTEDPLLTIIDASSTDRFETEEVDRRKTNIITAVDHLTVAERRRFNNLTCYPRATSGNRRRRNPPADIYRFLTNNFTFSRVTQQNNPNRAVQAYVVLEQLSRMNHSCVPNAIVGWNSSFACGRVAGELLAGQATVHALCPTAQGQEITICYKEDSMYETARDRKALLKKDYGFACTRATCHTQPLLSDSNCTELNRIHGKL